jgi:hypothetical protein
VSRDQGARSACGGSCARRGGTGLGGRTHARLLKACGPSCVRGSDLSILCSTPTLILVSSRKKAAYTVYELSELADGLRHLLDSIAHGSVVADTSTIRRLEGACAALDALVAGPPVTADFEGSGVGQADSGLT